ncbi:MAG: N-acetylmuramoyl-L-alanine amidase [Anaerolineaceae bacterium]|nr:N-acetylmuramoyl-L-alanine amidase [Anaerolineaceae bacterium]MCB9101419.1 N-acetylmuramoyl-L-alanine amidase [Anaerolineales bacterium]
MSKSRTPRRYQAVKRTAAKQGNQRAFSVTMFILFVASIVMGVNLYSLNAKPAPVIAQEVTPMPNVPISPPVQSAPTVGAVDITSLTVNRYTFSPLVGIVSGHKGYDPGAVCPDGLTEAEVNYAVAMEVTHLLARQGVQADILDEFDDRLTEYQADALVSIHADSCTIPGATGFKVARVTDSAIPEAEDLLVSCLYDQYGAYTGLPQHPSSITDNMTDYHAFREISRGTPGAIIETGFLLDDRQMLQYKPKIVARGIAAGILCFLDQRLARTE